MVSCTSIVRRPFYHEKKKLDDRHLIELELWQVPKNAATPEGVKYSLVLVRDGIRVVGYDNHERKGHHKHLFGKELPYTFTTVEALVKEFRALVDKILNEGGKV